MSVMEDLDALHSYHNIRDRFLFFNGKIHITLHLSNRLVKKNLKYRSPIGYELANPPARAMVNHNGARDFYESI